MSYRVDTEPPTAGDHSCRSVSSAGDVNGDDFDNLIVGAGNGVLGDGSNAAESYVIFGGDFLNVISAANIGGHGNDTLSGTAGNKSLIGGRGNNTLLGAGDDVLVYDALDTLRIDAQVFVDKDVSVTGAA